MTALIPSGLDLKILPNPFNAVTAINYELGAASHVNLKVYDTAGRVVATLLDGWREAGSHHVTFDGSQLASGLYFVKMQTGEYEGVKKIILLK
jgi:flagellar hook assembly protein FlgD